MMQPLRSSPDARRAGFAILSVLFVLLALLVLCTPYLMTARNADRAGSESADRAQLRLALDSAGRHARTVLAASHPAEDPTPYIDSEDELSVDNSFDRSFLDANDATGVMWDVEARDVSGLIDLSSASPQVVANMLDWTTIVSLPVKAEDDEIQVASAAGFDPAGELWIDGELLRYASIDENTFKGVERGLFTSRDEEGQWHTSGPRPPSAHALGSAVLDRRAFAIASWRVARDDGRLQTLRAPEELREAGRGVFDELAFESLSQLGSVHAGVRAGALWQHPTRLVAPVDGGVDYEIQVAEPRWYNAGATIEVSDGLVRELRMVESRQGAAILLDRVLEHGYDAYTAQVRVLARRPVNVNTAPAAVLEVLFANLQLHGRNERITEPEARALAGLAVAARPFDGLEDFLRRVVLPAAGLETPPADDEGAGERAVADVAVIDPYDAQALYRNALNANDGALAFATMPFVFASRDVYAMELRASVNAPSGIERVSAARDRVELVVPQRELFCLFARQQDFDEALRFSREGPWWTTGPEATSPFDSSTVPPSRFAAHMGGAVDVLAEDADTEPDVPDHVFPSLEDDGFVQLWPARMPSPDGNEEHVLHFDKETRDLEGRYLPDETVLRPASSKSIEWTGTGDGELLRSLAYSMWIKPRESGDAVLLDVGGTQREADRLLLVTEGEDLVLRVLDGFGDHSQSEQTEAGEVRFALAGDTSPGLPVDTWSHVQIDVRGNRPDQMTMLVNGLSHGVRTPGMTRLTQPLFQDGALHVESIEGFPARGVVRLGNELVEYVVEDDHTLRAERDEQGRGAGFGGRAARTRHTLAGIPEEVAELTVSHPAGTAVTHYGYSLPLASDLFAGSSQLDSDLGPWRVAKVMEVRNVGDDSPGEDLIQAGLGDFGTGLEANRESVDLVVSLGDEPSVDADSGEVVSSFNLTGGYAALIQVAWTANGGVQESAVGTPLGGVEVVRYSGYQGDVVRVVARGGNVGLRLLTGREEGGRLGGTRAFVVNWSPSVQNTGTGELIASRMRWATYLIPISLRVPGISALEGFAQPPVGESGFAQLTEIDEAERTEWVRYDEVDAQYGQLVRDDPDALMAAYDAIVGASTGALYAGDDDDDDQPHDGGGGPGDVGDTNHGIVSAPSSAPGPGAPGLPGPSAPGPSAPGPSATSPSAPGPRAMQAGGGPDWRPAMGESELDELPLSRAVASRFRFRGVLETFTHSHSAGTLVLPTFEVLDQGPDGGRPGREDTVFLVQPDTTHVGWPVTVHRAHRPWHHAPVHAWDQDGDSYRAVASGTSGAEPDGWPEWDDIIYVALQNPVPEPITSGSVAGAAGLQTTVDSRKLGRMVKFPSGELPRIVTAVGVGTGFDGVGALPTPSAVVDEVFFGTPRIGGGPGKETQGAQLLLDEDVGALDDTLSLRADRYRVARGSAPQANALSELEEQGGLLRIGEEILAYESRNASTGDVSVAVSGRGLLGTREQTHHTTEAVTYLEFLPTTVLLADISAGDSVLPVAGTRGFPSSGTLLIGEELVHYTWIRNGSFEMPRTSAEPGAMDAEGDGVFRGRFGTAATTHLAGEPVILFPFRYWDRWADRADCPELSYFGLEVDQPSAWWRSVYWEAEASGFDGATVGVLQRTDPDVPWDADPDENPGLTLMWAGSKDGGEVPIGVQSDRIEWRTFVRYNPGAFDLETGISHGWKETPRLRRLGVTFLAPTRVLGSFDR